MSRDGAFRLLSTPDEFREAYAPVRNSEEAAGLVIALADVDTTIDVPLAVGSTVPYRLLATSFDDAFAEKTLDGFQVHVFETRSCGCGPHTRFEIDFEVSASGSLSVKKKAELDQIAAGAECRD